MKTNETKNVYERYKEEICPECDNRHTDLCHITKRIDNTIKCHNYVRCMTTKCNTCKKQKKCFSITAKQTKPIMKGLV